jgi:exodeoxyribonuclease VII large subunit
MARQLLTAYNPEAALQRGYAMIRLGAGLVRRAGDLQAGDEITAQFADGRARATIIEVEGRK